MEADAIDSDAGSERGRSWPRYRLFGATLATDYRFANRLWPSESPPDLTFTCVGDPFWRDGRDLGAPAYWLPSQVEGEDPYLLSYPLEGGHLIRYSDVAEFWISRDEIVGSLLDDELDYLLEIRFLGSVMALWLELRGVLALHASAVAAGGEAIALSSWSRGGKTSAAAALMRAGHPLLTDDIVAIELADGRPTAHSGYPQMRMWPDEAAHFLGSADDLEIVHPMYSKRRVPVGDEGLGAYCADSLPLAALYILERDLAATRETISIAGVPPHEGVMQLLRHSFTESYVKMVTSTAARLRFLGGLVGAIPIRRVVHSVPIEGLDRLGAALLEDLAANRQTAHG